MDGVRPVGSRRAGVGKMTTTPTLAESAAASLRHPLSVALLVLTFSTGTVDAVSYLGLGLPDTTPTWGGMLSNGTQVIYDGYWWQLYPAGIAIVLTVVAFNFLGDGLRDTLDVPVVARVNGYALGGGMEMMLGCDIVVASADASFGLPEPRVGRLALDGGVALLARRIPHVQAMGMLLTGRRIGADEAFRFGLVNEVVAPGALDDAVARWVADILACAPLSVRAIKQMVRAGERVTAREAQMLRLPALIEALQSSDQDEGVNAFKEKRAPQWRGR